MNKGYSCKKKQSAQKEFEISMIIYLNLYTLLEFAIMEKIRHLSFYSVM